MKSSRISILAGRQWCAARQRTMPIGLTDPADYDNLIAELGEGDGKTSYDFAWKCAAKAYSATAAMMA
jgi:AICAR transformylase/IMP cyclohydrolase PurH